MIRHFLDLSDFDGDTLKAILADARRIKADRAASAELLRGKTLALVFEKPSTRTRISFDVGMRQLGGQTIVLSGGEMQLGRDETLADTGRVLSRYVDGVMIRILSPDDLDELAGAASIPVINGLTKRSHPCQVMADLMTLEEHRGSIAGKKIAWVGDATNVLTSFIHAAPRFGFVVSGATPAQYAPAPEVMAQAKKDGADVTLHSKADEAVDGADVVVTDTWVSMGAEADRVRRLQILEPYTVTAKLMTAAKKDALFMHCLPAHRGEEVEADVIDGPQSVVWDEAENRLHAQKGILAWSLGGDRR